MGKKEAGSITLPAQLPTGLPIKSGKKSGKNQRQGSKPLCHKASYAIGFMVGKSRTSRMLSELVSSITKRSKPKPRPPVGGRPYSRAHDGPFGSI